MTDVASEPRPAPRLRFLLRLRLVHLVPVLVVLGLGAWVVASPVGASPDDDYHLASIWCANEARTDLCAPDPVHGEGWRLVLPGLMTAPCYVTDGAYSAACQEWVSDPTPTVAADHGNWINAYPPVYYAVMNAFASTDIQSSALLMRLVNVLLFVAYTTALAVLLPAKLRVPLVAGWAITMVPLSAFLLASNNPGAWALIGVGGSWLAAFGWFRTTGRRSWALGGLTALGVLLAAGARTDAAIYSILGLGIASFLSFRWSKAFGLKMILPGVLIVIAAAFYAASGYATVAEGGLNGGIPNSEGRNLGAILGYNLVSMPQLWTGVFGSWGLGWRMEQWPGFPMVEFAGLVVFVGLVSLGIRHMDPRRAVMSVALVGTLYLLPLYVLTRGRSVVGENVQPRYILPLVIVLGGLLLLTRAERALVPSVWHVVPGIILLSGANAVALYTNLRRYVTGFTIERLGLEDGAEWWWSGAPAGPTAVWVIGSLAFAGAFTILGVTWLRSRRGREAVA